VSVEYQPDHEEIHQYTDLPVYTAFTLVIIHTAVETFLSN